MFLCQRTVNCRGILSSEAYHDIGVAKENSLEPKRFLKNLI